MSDQEIYFVRADSHKVFTPFHMWHATRTWFTEGIETQCGIYYQNGRYLLVLSEELKQFKGDRCNTKACSQHMPEVK